MRFLPIVLRIFEIRLHGKEGGIEIKDADFSGDDGNLLIRQAECRMKGDPDGSGIVRDENQAQVLGQI